MFRKICCIIAVVCILVSSFVVSSSAAGSTFQSDLLPVTSFVDLLGYRHDFLFLFGDDLGLVLEFKYKDGIGITLSFNLTVTDLEYTVVSVSTQSFEVFYRDLKTGQTLGDQNTNVDGTYESSYLSFYNSLTNSKLLDYNYSDFHYYSIAEGSSYSFYVFTSSFIAGTVIFTEQNDEYFITPLTEPVFDDSNYWIVLQGSKCTLMHIYFDLSLGVSPSLSGVDFEVFLSVDQNGKYVLNVFNPFESPFGFYMYYSLYDLSNGWFLGSGSRLIDDNLTINKGYLSATVYTYPQVKCYGLGFVNDYGYSVSLPTILWHYDELIAQAITAQTLLFYSQILQINNGIDELEDYLRLLNINIESIHDILLDIRNSLINGESYPQPPTDALDGYLSDESKVYDALPTGMQENIDIAFDSASVSFDGNGAFGLIRSLMQSFAFSNSKISGFIFFSLAIGIAVLILGRKINSA